jgi:hypothetical protein
MEEIGREKRDRETERQASLYTMYIFLKIFEFQIPLKVSSLLFKKQKK